jgi:hypothetical protein
MSRSRSSSGRYIPRTQLLCQGMYILICYVSPPPRIVPRHHLPSVSHSISRLGIRRERSLEGGFRTTNTMTRMSPPLPSSSVPLGSSFAPLASVPPPQRRTNRVQSQSTVKVGGAGDRGDTITAGTAAVTGNNTTRSTFRSLPYKSPTIAFASIIPKPETTPSIT